MARDPFLIVLALLTAVSGVTLLVMIARRRKLAPSQGSGAERGVEASRERLLRATAQREADDDEHETQTDRRLIDDYAIPVSFERARDRLGDDEPDIGKICPRCGARYGSHHRFCERDNSELAALN